jgi:hypothetical protein
MIQKKEVELHSHNDIFGLKVELYTYFWKKYDIELSQLNKSNTYWNI